VNIAYSIFKENEEYNDSLYHTGIPVEYIFSDTKSHYASHYGFLNVVSIEHGNYYLSPVIKDRSVHYNYEVTEAVKYNFNVKPNEMVYIGEFFVYSPCSISSKLIL
jgi:hypothetical protein